MTDIEGDPPILSPPTFGEIVRHLQRIESRLDRVMSDHEDRLRRVERWVYAVPTALLIAAASAVAAVFQ